MAHDEALGQLVLDAVDDGTSSTTIPCLLFAYDGLIPLQSFKFALDDIDANITDIDANVTSTDDIDIDNPEARRPSRSTSMQPGPSEKHRNRLLRIVPASALYARCRDALSSRARCRSPSSQPLAAARCEAARAC